MFSKKHSYWVGFIGLTIGLFAVTATIQSKTSAYPPVWDSLVYQNYALKMAHNFLAHQWAELTQDVGQNRPIGHIATLATSYLFFGFHQYSAHIVGALYSLFCLFAFYKLAVAMGARPVAATLGALCFGLFPSVVYQNYFESRNDFPLAACVALTWAYLLRASKERPLSSGFIAGLWSGLGTLFKLSAPGYMIWGLPFVFLLKPKSKSHSWSMTVLGSYACGAVIACGWHYLPALPKVLHYHAKWRLMTEWQNAQYSLTSSSDRILFYLKNLCLNHFGAFFCGLLALVIVALLVVTYLRSEPAQRQTFERQFLKNPSTWAIVAAAILPIVFITMTGSLSSLGDVPVLILIGSLMTTLLSSLWPTGLTAPRGPRTIVGWLLAPFVILMSVSKIQAVPIFGGADVRQFANEVRLFRKEFGLHNQAMMTVFSHPRYRADAYQWLQFMDQNGGIGDLDVPPDDDWTELLSPGDLKTIAGKISQYPMLIVSDVGMTQFGGESFHTFNRLQSALNRDILSSNQFEFKRRIYVNEQKVPLDFYIKKDFCSLATQNKTADGWIEWGATFSLYCLLDRPIALRIRPVHALSGFKLIDDQGNKISFVVKGCDTLGRCIYEGRLPRSGADKLHRLKLWSDGDMKVASLADPRRLAFRDFELIELP